MERRAVLWKGHAYSNVGIRRDNIRCLFLVMGKWICTHISYTPYFTDKIALLDVHLAPQPTCVQYLNKLDLHVHAKLGDFEYDL